MNSEYKQKLEYFCAYQERCHSEVLQKMMDLNVPYAERDEIMVHLIEHNFLNETRFAQSFARGKHSIKKWGRNRIVNELKFRKISSHNIQLALKEIPEDAYEATFLELAQKQWQSVTEKNILKKKKKVADFLLRKGYESQWIYDFINQQE